MNTKIYVACLAAYNNGKLHGRWIDLENKSFEEVQEEIQEMLANSPEPDAEEWAIHDYEMPGGITISEYEDLEGLVELVEALSEHGEAFAYYYAYMGDLSSALQYFDDAYCGEWDTFEEYVEHLFDECYLLDIPESVRYYIDYDKFARDLSIDHYYDGGHVFRCV